MIRNPSQFQLDKAVRNGDNIKVTKLPFYYQIALKLIDRISGNSPVYVKYKEKEYDQRCITINTKEELESYCERNCQGEIYNLISTNVSLQTIPLFGNIDYIMMKYKNETIKFKYSDIKTLIDIISTRYNRALDGKEISYKEISRIQLTEFIIDSNKYIFKNGSGLDITYLSNIKNNKMKICESFLGIETEEYPVSTEREKEEAVKNFENILVARIDLLLKNPLIESDLIVEKINLGEDTSIEI